MRAIVQDGYGGPEVLRIGDVAVPDIPDEAVLVRVLASSVNAGDWRRMRGAPVLVRLVEGMRRPRNPLLGGDAAGVVEAVGGRVTHLRPGDEVYGIRSGAFAEYVSGRNFVRKPAGLSFEEAAAIPIAGVTALQAVRDHGALREGQRVLVNGAGGGVGTFAVQIARALGGRVTGVTRSDSVDLVRRLGAEEVIDHADQDFTRIGDRFDLVVDLGGNRSIRDLRRILAPGGRLVLTGAGRGSVGPMTRLLGGQLRMRVLRQPVAVYIAAVRREDLETLGGLVDAGQVRPVIDRSYPLDGVPEALRLLESGGVRGKIIIGVARS